MTDNYRLMSVEKLTLKGKILCCMCMHGTDFIILFQGAEIPSMRKPACNR